MGKGRCGCDTHRMKSEQSSWLHRIISWFNESSAILRCGFRSRLLAWQNIRSENNSTSCGDLLTCTNRMTNTNYHHLTSLDRVTNLCFTNDNNLASDFNCWVQLINVQKSRTANYLFPVISNFDYGVKTQTTYHFNSDKQITLLKNQYQWN